MKISSAKIDWANHIIGFLSALFGILIAFELEEWRQNRHDHREAQEAFAKLKEEILVNKTALHEATASNQKLISLLGKEILPHVTEDLIFNGSAAEAMQWNKKWRPVAQINIDDTTRQKIVVPVSFFMSPFVIPSLHNAAWESAKESGIMNNMEYDKVLTISYVYNNPKITDELNEIRRLLRQADEVNSKTALRKLLLELRESHSIIERELTSFDMFASMIAGME